MLLNPWPCMVPARGRQFSTFLLCVWCNCWWLRLTPPSGLIWCSSIMMLCYGRWRKYQLPMFDLPSLNVYVTLTRLKRWSFWCWVYQGRGLCVLDWPQGYLFSSGLSTLSLNCAQRESPAVEGSLLWPFYSSPGIHQSACSGNRVGSPNGDSTRVLSGQLVGDCRVGFSLVKTLWAAPSALQGPGCYHDIEK